MDVPSLKKLQRSALRLVKDSEQMNQLVRRAGVKARAHHSRIGAFWEELKILLRMLKAYLKGEYRDLSWKTILSVIGALLYFVNPFDLVADFLYVFGFLDDALVVGLVFSAVRSDLERFTEWEMSAKIPAGSG